MISLKSSTIIKYFIVLNENSLFFKVPSLELSPRNFELTFTSLNGHTGSSCEMQVSLLVMLLIRKLKLSGIKKYIIYSYMHHRHKNDIVLLISDFTHSESHNWIRII